MTSNRIFGIFALAICCAGGSLQNPDNNKTSSGLRAPVDVSEFAKQLPPGSDLLVRLQAGQRGDGIEKPYMVAMRRENVRRALFEIDATWQDGGSRAPHVVRRLYFSKYDGDHAQIVDVGQLATIKSSGLEELLEQVALERTNSAGLFALHGLKGAGPWQVHGFQEFFDNPILPEFRTPLFQATQPRQALIPFTKLLDSSSIGDAMTVVDLVRRHDYSREELNGALFQAVRHDHDNTAVIEALLKAGADINARGNEGMTPLMMAVDKPLNLSAVLRLGASLNERDDYGDTALKLAEKNHRIQSIELLRAAGAAE